MRLSFFKKTFKWIIIFPTLLVFLKSIDICCWIVLEFSFQKSLATLSNLPKSNLFRTPVNLVGPAIKTGLVVMHKNMVMNCLENISKICPFTETTRLQYHLLDLKPYTKMTISWSRDIFNRYFSPFFGSTYKDHLVPSCKYSLL